jgi:hypothetical protein
MRTVTGMGWFRIEDRSGGSARLLAMLMDLPEFYGIALAHVSSAAADAQFRAILEAIVNGHPPLR